MIQTVTVNSALSQNWVGYTVRTPKAQAERTLRPGRALSAVSQRALGRVPRRVAGRVAARTGCVAGRVARRVIAPRSRYKICIATQILATRTACRVVARTSRVAAPVTIQKIVSRHTPVARPHARATPRLCS